MPDHVRACDSYNMCEIHEVQEIREVREVRENRAAVDTPPNQITTALFVAAADAGAAAAAAALPDLAFFCSFCCSAKAAALDMASAFRVALSSGGSGDRRGCPRRSLSFEPGSQTPAIFRSGP